MRLLAKKMDKGYLRETFDFSLLKWFHEHGIPQVIQTTREMYKSPVDTTGFSNYTLGPSRRGLCPATKNTNYLGFNLATKLHS